MKRYLLFWLSVFFAIGVYAQNDDDFYMGMLVDDEAYEKIPEQVTQLSRDYTILPSSHSLQKYCPTPKSQGQYSTCTSWACAYAARTIAEAIKNGWTNKVIIDNEAFSPPFVYKQIKDKGDSNCAVGTYISDALALMKEKGVPKYNLFSPLCAEYIPTSLYSSAFDYRINNYFRLYSLGDNTDIKIQKTKKSLAEDRPVVFGMWCYASFQKATDVWDGNRDVKRGAHAMCVVGYDDNKYGGAFLIMNSWGTKWGNGGFTWVRYKDYVKDAIYAYELYVPKSNPNPAPKPAPNPKPSPTPSPSPSTVEKPAITWLSALTSSSSKFAVKVGVKSKKKITSVSVTLNGSVARGINSVTNDGFEFSINQDVTLRPGVNTIVVQATNSDGTARLEKNITYNVVKNNLLSGSFYVQLATGEKMQVKRNVDNTAYRVLGSYISGTRYRVYISNNEPAYVYVIGSDLANSISKVFPPAENVSPALVYKSNNIALPNEKWYMEMDKTVGTDYLCVLYSKDPLDIGNVISRMKSSTGNIYQRLQTVLGSKLAPKADIQYLAESANFSAKTSASIVPVVLEITHK